MERKTLAIGIGVGMLGAAGVGLGAMIKARRRRMSARHRSDLRQRASADDRSRGAAASFSGDIPGGPVAGANLGRRGNSTATATVRDGGAGASPVPRENLQGGEPPAADSHPRRTSTRMAPGIPVGSGRGIEAALAQPDSDIGGAVAGDTAVGGKEGETGRDERTIRNDDHDRTTM